MAFEESQSWYTLLAVVFVAFDTVLGNTIVGRFSEALLWGSYDCWNLEVQAQNCTAAVVLRTPQPLRVEEE